MSKTSYEDFINAISSSVGYWKSFSLIRFTTSLVRIMKLENTTGKELSLRLGVSTAQVSKVLRGQENVTVETMAKFADALDAVVHIHVAKRGVQVRWHELPSQEAASHSMTFDPLPTRTVVKLTAHAAYARRNKQNVQEKSIDMDPPLLKESRG